MPRIHKIPDEYLKKNNTPLYNTIVYKSITNLINNEQFEQIFPYNKVSSVFTHDSKSFWRLEDLYEAVYILNTNENTEYHNFCSDSDNDTINILELCAFLANTHQETGDPSLESPYPWGYPKGIKKGEIHEGPSGGCIGIMEGCVPSVLFGNVVYKSEKEGPLIELSKTEQHVLQMTEPIRGVLLSMLPIDQPQFGLGQGTGNGAILSDNCISVSDNGKLWGDIPYRHTPLGYVYPISEYKKDIGDRDYASLGPYAQYGGRGAIQLSYNYNYTECSLALFGDYRLVKYPNLITTTDRENFNGNSFYFGFPGINSNGNNQLPDDIKNTTPSARVLAWMTCLWFWMSKNRSGRKISCHEAMLNPFEIGVTTVNAIINNQSGLKTGTWASKKIEYYKRIIKIMGIESDSTERSIISPPHILSKLKE